MKGVGLGVLLVWASLLAALLIALPLSRRIEGGIKLKRWREEFALAVLVTFLQSIILVSCAAVGGMICEGKGKVCREGEIAAGVGLILAAAALFVSYKITHRKTLDFGKIIALVFLQWGVILGCVFLALLVWRLSGWQ